MGTNIHGEQKNSDAYTDGYLRGLDVAIARAISRIKLGLPVAYPSDRSSEDKDPA